MTPSLPSLPLACVMVLAVAGAVSAEAAAQTAPPASSAAASAVSLLGRPRYDANEQALRIPFAGAVPVWTRGSLKAPPRIFIDFDAPSRLVGVVSEGVPNHPVWLSWAMAPRDRVKTRLTLVFRRDTTITVRVDRDHGQMLVVPRIPAPESPARPATGATAGATPGPDESLPLVEPTPTPAPRRTAPPATPRPTMTPWVLPTTPPTTSSTTSPTAEPRPRPTMTPWIPVRTPSPLPSDLSIYLPGSPEPAETPTITISTTPALPTPAPIDPVPTPAPAARRTGGPGGGDTLVATSIAYGPADESGGPAGAARADNQRVIGARLATKLWAGPRDRVLADGWLPWWGLGFDLYGADAIYRDAASALRARQEARAHLSLTRGVRLSPLELQGGLGLQGRYETAWTQGPAGPTVAGRGVFAPELVALGRLPFGPSGLGLYGEAAVAPVAVVTGPGAVGSGFGGSRFEVGVTGDWAGLRLGLGYRHWSLSGGGYGETFQGPVLTLGGWLDGASD